MPVSTTETKLKNKRLSQGDRETLYRFAKKQVAATADTAALDNAYEFAADAVSAAVAAKCPQKDMAVLAKYGFAHPDSCVYVSTGGGDYRQFTFMPDDKRILLRPRMNCNRQPLLLEGDSEKAMNAFDRAKKQHDAAITSRLDDFKALIYGSPAFNTVVSVWPAAEELREIIVGTGSALQVLSADVVARLQADPAFAVAA